VLLTRGARGSVAFTAEGERVAVPAKPVAVVNTIGAGDAFVAGFLHTLGSSGALGGGPVLLGRPEVEAAVAFAGRIAASVVASSGTTLEAGHTGV
jgi:fructokinase